MSGPRRAIPRPALALVEPGDDGGAPPGGPMEPLPGRPVIALRPGELFLKGANRRIFVDAVERQVRRAVSDLGAVVRRLHLRFLVEGVEHSAEALLRLRRVFGIHSVIPAWVLPREIEAWERFAVHRARMAIGRGARTFAIDCERPDKSFPIRSPEVNARVGSAVREATDLAVDLERPDWRFRLEVAVEETFAWEGALPGAGGLPVGTGGRVLLLLSGGIDSPVAGHLIQKRGVVLDAVYFDAFPYTGPGARQKAVELARRLAEAQGPLRLHVVPFAAVQELLRDHVPADHLVLLYRRAMIRIAERLAGETGARALATGESLGQVASQTLENLAVIDEVAALPILRPLISHDKSETIALAQRIGTYDISIRPHADCCSLFAAKHPATRAKPERVRRYEAAVETGPAIEAAIAGVEREEIE
jgi:thiamine biosynthesis protein ThiI